MSNSETLADILAEMRKGCVFAWEGCKFEGLADRIEAAVVRLVREERTEAIDEALAHAEEVRAERCRNCTERAPGNASALREAMVLFVHDFASFREDVEHGRLHMMQCMDFIKGFIPLMESALAAPPRNCDRFGSYEDALEYWREQVECAEDNGSFDVWLMAHAEGGAEC